MEGGFMQFFQELSTQEGLLILVLIVIAFLIGALIGWFIQHAAVKKMERTLQHKEEQMQVVAQERIRLEEELTLREADIKRASFELEESQAARRHLLDTNHRLQQEMDALHLELDKAQAANRQYLSTVEDLNDQILGMKMRNSGQAEGEDAAGHVSEPSDDQGAAHTLIGTFAEQRLTEIEQRLRLLEQEKEQQRWPKSDMNAEVHELPINTGSKLEDRLLEVEDEEEEEERIFQPNTFVLPTQPDEARTVVVQDDLTRIDGIGPFLQKKLNEMGVYSFAQISAWDAAQIEEVTRQIQFFEGRIEKDDWVGQAQRLMDDPTPPAQVTSAQEALPEDDLKLIEGIGPSVESILKRAGIITFEVLAKSDPEEIETIVQLADSKLRFINATTWPAQARLAMNEEWEVLKDYQDQLKGGMPIRDEDEIE